jgi:2-keto-4-pentenoate hydratase/2-oxohepta-3-ene-1,7-dioic acid hydratase in catechol pathway
MKLLRVGPAGAEIPVALDDSTPDVLTCYDLRSLTADIDGEFLGRLAAGLRLAGLPAIDITGQRLGPPLVRPSVILCVGQNYAAHAAESGQAPPSEPIMFYKAPNTLSGPYDDVLIPRGSVKTDWEVELAVVIGKRARYLSSPAEALGCVGAYAVSNDLSERTFQLEVSGGQWSKGKSCETFNPLGPWLVTPDEIEALGGPQRLRLRSWVNGEPRQDSSTADMIFDVGTLIWHLSQFTVLEPGDVINTGTPPGVALSGRFPYLKPDDLVEVEIDGLGHQRVRMVAA